MAATLVSVAGGIISNVAGPPVTEQFKLLWGMKKELRKLESTVKAIEAVLKDADEQQVRGHAVQDWLEKLTDVLYEADDLLDSVSTEALQRKVTTTQGKKAKVRKFFFKSKRLFNNLRMANKIKDIREKLDDIVKERNFQLVQGPVERRVVSFSSRDTAAYLGDEIIIGREDDKKAVIELLDANDEVNLSIVAIVGIGGLGKTSLASLIFNDKEFTKKFDRTLWACVSDRFDVNTILERILESATGEKPKSDHVRNTLLTLLRNEINGKRYFLVLDDVWNEDSAKWSDLKNCLKSDVKGSRILVTTRAPKVANAMHTNQYVLKGLDEDKSWNLFKQMAFENPEESIDARIEEIGKEIVRKCRGVPLAVKAVGRSLRSQSLQYWSFREIELSSLPHQNSETDILLLTLKLSYDKLPYRLKQCFAYCSLFPKNYKYNRLTLISLWIAQGFVESRFGKCLEDVGDEYFKDLLFGSFFKEAEMDNLGDIIKCKMHDCMHDLAISVAGSLFSIVDDERRNINRKTRFIAFHDVSKISSIDQFSIKANAIRTFLCLSKISFSQFKGDIDYEVIFSSFLLLRVLNLCDIGLKCLPGSVCKLKHLRYLDISENKIKELPQSITKLQNLQTLNLDYCNELLELPRSISKLVNLRELIFGSPGHKLTHMPCGLGQLTSLERLPLFIVDESFPSKDSGGLNELNGLNNLRGTLTIMKLRHERSFTSDYVAMNLGGKSRVSRLELRWSVPSANNAAGDMLLDGLHPNLKELSLNTYPCSSLSTLISSHASLVKLSMISCIRCQSLSSLSQLRRLKVLQLSVLRNLEYISDCNDENRLSSSNSVLFFPMLEECFISCCPKLRGWCKRDSSTEGGNGDGEITAGTSIEVPHLSFLEVDSCPMWTTMPKCPRLQTLRLTNTTSPMLRVPSTHNSLSQLKCLYITNCAELELANHEDGIPWQCLKELEKLSFRGLPKLVTLPSGLEYVTALRTLRLDNCSGLTTIPEWIHKYKSLESLRITDCSNLTSLPEGMSRLSSLRRLAIVGCPILQQRCEREIGEDWPKIKHIPDLHIPS